MEQFKIMVGKARNFAGDEVKSMRQMFNVDVNQLGIPGIACSFNVEKVGRGAEITALVSIPDLGDTTKNAQAEAQLKRALKRYKFL